MREGKGEMGSEEEENHDIVIVGGGICGLATALALQRKGMHSLVLEKSDTLRASGAAIGVFINGWRALDQLGIGTELRKKAIPLTEVREMWLHKNKMQVTPCREEGLRCLKRSDLIETMADSLPMGSIRLGCQIIAVESDPITSFHSLYTNDGVTIKAKVLIGCDGSNSVIAKSLGLQAPKVFPISVVRGFTSYSNGHSFGSHFIRLRGDGVVFGRLPVDEKLVHWFVGRLYRSSQDSNVQKDLVLIKEFALESLKEFPPEVIEIVKHCDISSLSLTHLRYRAPWHLLFANFWQGTMTVAGDAMHVMGPFLGQGGSAGLEDAIVLARCLAREMPKTVAVSDQELGKRIGRALNKYVNERRLRVMRLCTQSYLVGSMITASSWVKKLICLAILIVFLGGFSLSHTSYDCGPL